MNTSETNPQPPLAPILISVYDRKQHLENCIEALKKNPEAERTPLYIVSDGWKHAGHRAAVEEVRAYINAITGFREIHTRFRETNWGMRASAMDAFEWVFAEHDRLIRMEDDIVCSPYYLRYMNEGLEMFTDDKRIFCICAHTHPKFKPPRDYPHETYLWNTFTPWGFATWKGRWDTFTGSTEAEPGQLSDRTIWRSYRKTRPLLDTRNMYLEGKIHNDGRLNLHMFLNDLYAVYPTRNLTINEGMDGSGTNCARGWTYAQQSLSETPIQTDAQIQPVPAIGKLLYHLHYSLINHGIGLILRSIGLFDPLYKCYQKMVSRRA
jgi:hypothetical protein